MVQDQGTQVTAEIPQTENPNAGESPAKSSQEKRQKVVQAARKALEVKAAREGPKEEVHYLDRTSQVGFAAGVKYIGDDDEVDDPITCMACEKEVPTCMTCGGMILACKTCGGLAPKGKTLREIQKDVDQGLKADAYNVSGFDTPNGVQHMVWETRFDNDTWKFRNQFVPCDLALSVRSTSGPNGTWKQITCNNCNAAQCRCGTWFKGSGLKCRKCKNRK